MEKGLLLRLLYLECLHLAFYDTLLLRTSVLGISNKTLDALFVAPSSEQR